MNFVKLLINTFQRAAQPVAQKGREPYVSVVDGLEPSSLWVIPETPFNFINWSTEKQVGWVLRNGCKGADLVIGYDPNRRGRKNGDINLEGELPESIQQALNSGDGSYRP